MEKLKFGELEVAILQIVEELGRASVRDVGKKLDREYTTIMTVMGRLFEKRAPKGKVRQAIHLLENPSKSVFKRIQEKFFGTKPAAIVSYLLESDQISDAELEEIEKLIAKRRNG